MLALLKNWLYSRQHKERYAALNGLLKTQQLSPEQLLQKQQADLQAILRYAATHSNYYQNRFPEPSETDQADWNIQDIPVLTKQDVIQYKDQILCANVDKNTVRLGHTGGSTGKPLAFYYDNYKIELMRAGMSRSYMWAGWQPGEKILNFWGASQDIKTKPGFQQQWHEFIKAEKTIGAYQYSEAQLQQWSKSIQSYRPVLIQGYASIIAELARYIIDTGQTMPGSIKGVFSTAEVLYEAQRNDIQQAFSCRVHNQYGSREIPNIACECKHGQQHILTDMVYLESVRQDNEDKLLITSLTNHTMPFIRYEIGDAGKLKSGSCDCGLPFPIMEMGMCRSNDIIKTSQGKKIYPSYFIHLLDDLHGIKHYQFIQHENDRISLNIVAEEPLDNDTSRLLQQKIHMDVSPDMQLEINYRQKIARTASGKHRFVISE